MGSQRFVQSESIANNHHPSMYRCAQIPDEPTDKNIELIHVDCHF